MGKNTFRIEYMREYVIYSIVVVVVVVVVVVDIDQCGFVTHGRLTEICYKTYLTYIHIKAF